jgi:hypothetical protein
LSCLPAKRVMAGRAGETKQSCLPATADKQTS